MKDARKKSINLALAASFKTVLLVVGLSGGLGASGTAVAGGRGTPQPPAIIKTAIDVKENVLIIIGHRFGETRPTVTLSDQILDVKRFSDHEVVASLPPDLEAATYGVTVIANGRNRASSNLFSTTLP
jgi:hypothetical protein